MTRCVDCHSIYFPFREGIGGGVGRTIKGRFRAEQGPTKRGSTPTSQRMSDSSATFFWSMGPL